MAAALIPMMGRALMGVGADIAGPAAARSAAGSVLKTGKGAGIKESVRMKEMGDNLKAAKNKILQIAGILAKASPMFSQQMVIINKSLQLFLRPIGDIMAKFLRPMAIWLIKVAMKWNQLFGGNQGDNKGPGAKDDAKDQAQKALDLVNANPNSTQAEKDSAQNNLDQYNKVDTGALSSGAESLSKSFTDAYNSMSIWGAALPVFKQTSDNFWKDIIPASLVTLWDSMKESAKGLWDALKALWDVLKPILEPLWELTKALGGSALFLVVLALTGAFKVLTFLFLGLKTVFELIEVVVILMWDALKGLWQIVKDVGAWIGDTFGPVFTALWDGMKSLWTWIKDVFVNVWDSLWTKLKNIWDKIIHLGGLIPSGTKAVGGPVQSTGLYTLHAGERVMTSGDSQRNKTSGTNNTSVNNYISLNANVSSDIDIKTLARRLAEYSETELRRRVSYV